MSDYEIERERERRRIARWTVFYILIALVICVYIFAHWNEYKAAITQQEAVTIKVEKKFILNTPGYVKIRDFRDNIIFESEDKNLSIEILDNQRGFIVKSVGLEEHLVGAFLGDGWYSLELNSPIKNKEEIVILQGDIEDNEKQTN